VLQVDYCPLRQIVASASFLHYRDQEIKWLISAETTSRECCDLCNNGSGSRIWRKCGGSVNAMYIGWKIGTVAVTGRNAFWCKLCRYYAHTQDLETFPDADELVVPNGINIRQK
jgi:hypothetical protein